MVICVIRLQEFLKPRLKKVLLHFYELVLLEYGARPHTWNWQKCGFFWEW